jgi:hypothetical protein
MTAGVFDAELQILKQYAEQTNRTQAEMLQLWYWPLMRLCTTRKGKGAIGLLSAIF